MINLHQILHYLLHAFSAKRNGHGVHSPFAYGLCEEVFYNADCFYDFEELNEVRERLRKDPTRLEIGSFGAGSKAFHSNNRKVKDITAKGISSPLQSELFYRLINYLQYTSTLELGTSLGLNTLYLARANRAGTVVSIEGSKALYNLALALAEKNKTNNIQFVNAEFDQVLPGILRKLKTVDFLYIDGNHSYEATLRYFQQALPHMPPQSVMVFDDIYWSRGMTRAWKQIRQHPSVTLSIDTFYFGLVFFRPEIKEKTHLKLFI
jgi:predicted O-methyltransferase YrrM